MIELPLVFCAGLLGSAHCIGMCGAFVITIAAQTPRRGENAARQLCYTLGRLFTYGWLGAIAGYGGMTLVGRNHWWPAVLATVAGSVLLYEGLRTVGWLPGRTVSGTSGCLAGSLLGPLLRRHGRTGIFLAGVATGLMPCGLLYGMVGAAAATSGPLAGAVLMSVFALGTAPAMVLTGMTGSLLGARGRERLFQWAGWCLVLTAMITVGRGLMASPLWVDDPSCPFCSAAHEPLP